MRTRKVLTVNHVFEILAMVSQGVGWGEALVQVIPGRKGATIKEGVGEEREEELEINDEEVEVEVEEVKDEGELKKGEEVNEQKEKVIDEVIDGEQEDKVS